MQLSWTNWKKTFAIRYASIFTQQQYRKCTPAIHKSVGKPTIQNHKSRDPSSSPLAKLLQHTYN